MLLYFNETTKYNNFPFSAKTQKGWNNLSKKLKILKFVVRTNNPFVPLTIANYSGRIFFSNIDEPFFDSSVQFRNDKKKHFFLNEYAFFSRSIPRVFIETFAFFPPFFPFIFFFMAKRLREREKGKKMQRRFPGHGCWSNFSRFIFADDTEKYDCARYLNLRKHDHTVTSPSQNVYYWKMVSCNFSFHLPVAFLLVSSGSTWETVAEMLLLIPFSNQLVTAQTILSLVMDFRCGVFNRWN